jgi:hypothetical protein
MADIHRWSERPRSVAAAVVLQLHGGIDPDSSRLLADRVVFAVDRVKARGHTHAAPTDGEVQRARAALSRDGYDVTPEHVRAALEAAFVKGWGS